MPLHFFPRYYIRSCKPELPMLLLAEIIMQPHLLVHHYAAWPLFLHELSLMLIEPAILLPVLLLFASQENACKIGRRPLQIF